MIGNVSLANSTLLDLKRRADAGDAVAQCGVCAATSAAKQFVVMLVHEKK